MTISEHERMKQRRAARIRRNNPTSASERYAKEYILNNAEVFELPEFPVYPNMRYWRKWYRRLKGWRIKPLGYYEDSGKRLREEILKKDFKQQVDRIGSSEEEYDKLQDEYETMLREWEEQRQKVEERLLSLFERGFYKIRQQNGWIIPTFDEVYYFVDARLDYDDEYYCDGTEWWAMMDTYRRLVYLAS